MARKSENTGNSAHLKESWQPPGKLERGYQPTVEVPANPAPPIGLGSLAVKPGGNGAGGNGVGSTGSNQSDNS
jgi:hypothetical protein